MKTLIVYATKHGCTEACADRLSKKLSGNVDLCNLKEGKLPDLSQYDKIIIGGPVYIGKISKEVNEFCAGNLEVLKNKKVGLFICGMSEDTAMDEIKASFPAELLEGAAAREYFGGEFIFSRMNFFERVIVRKIAKVDKDVSKILVQNIDNFAKAMDEA